MPKFRSYHKAIMAATGRAHCIHNYCICEHMYANICEHAIVCVKIVAECKEYVLMETVAIQDTQDRVFLFIRFLYPDETRPETRKRPKKWADLCGEPSRISSISCSPLLEKPIAFHGLYILLYL